MLNILNLKTKQTRKIKYNKKSVFRPKIGNTPHYPSAIQEWRNSIYSYNKNTLKLLPSSDKVLQKIIKNYFNLYSKFLEKKIELPYISKRMKRLSTTKIHLSKAEFKHTSNKIVINIYIYNRQAIIYINKKFFFFKKKFYLKALRHKNIIKFLKNKNINNLYHLMKDNKLEKKFKSFKRKWLTNESLKVLKSEYFNFFTFLSKNNINTLKLNKRKINILKINIYFSFILKSLIKEKIFLSLKQIMFLNKFKFQNTFLLSLQILIQKIYNKKIEFNLVTLKNFHLNSDILTQIIGTKLKKREFTPVRVLTTSLRNIKIPYENIIYSDQYKNDKNYVQNIIINNIYDESSINLNNSYYDVLEKRLKLFMKKKKYIAYNRKNIFFFYRTVLNSIQQKAVSGVRLEASGRLTRRFVAAKAIYKLRYIGNLRNIQSTILNRSSINVRGNLKSNLQFSKFASRRKIGSFGLKGWINSP